MYVVIIKNLNLVEERIVLSRTPNAKAAQELRKRWRTILGNKHWTIDRRPGLDTLDHLAITVIEE